MTSSARTLTEPAWLESAPANDGQRGCQRCGQKRRVSELGACAPCHQAKLLELAPINPDGMDAEEIAELVGLTPQRVRQLLVSAIAKLSTNPDARELLGMLDRETHVSIFAGERWCAMIVTWPEPGARLS